MLWRKIGIFINVTIGDEFDEMEVKPTISLKNIVTLSKLSATTYIGFW